MENMSNDELAATIKNQKELIVFQNETICRLSRMLEDADAMLHTSIQNEITRAREFVSLAAKQGEK